MSDLPTRARAQAWVIGYPPGDPDEPETAVVLRSCADLCDTYREALEPFVEMVDEGFFSAYMKQLAAEDIARARLALATGDQTPDSGVDTPHGDA